MDAAAGTPMAGRQYLRVTIHVSTKLVTYSIYLYLIYIRIDLSPISNGHTVYPATRLARLSSEGPLFGGGGLRAY